MKPNHLLKRAREMQGWSQARLAEKLGTNATEVSRWERGVSFPYPHFREKLCTLFGKSIQELGLLQPADDEGEAVIETETAHNSLQEKRIYDPAIPLPLVGTGQLIGRDALLARLKQRLCTDNNNFMLTALNGLPGVGKTALATALVYEPEVQAHFQAGVLWAGLGPRPNVQGLLNRWGMLLGISPMEMEKAHSTEAWTSMFRSAIGMRRLLLVIDDAWEIEDALAFNVGGPNCAYLITTRFPHIAVSVAVDGAILVPELREDDGVALLARFVPELVTQDAAIAQSLVRSVGSLPLALTLIGKYLHVQTYVGQPRRLKSAIARLHAAEHRVHLSMPSISSERPPSLPTGTPLSLQSVIAASDQQLDERARAALRAISVFPAKPNSFSEPFALAVCQVEVDTLDTLVDAGLLESAGADRYVVHQTIADYARLYLTGSEASAAYQRFITYAVQYAETHQTNYDALERDSSVLLAALEAAYKLEYRAELVRGVCAFVLFLQLRGAYSLAEQHLQRAREAAAALNDRPGLAHVLLHLGEIAQKQGNYVLAEDYLQAGLELARQAEHRELMSALLKSLGVVAHERGNYAQAETYFQEGLISARQIDHAELISRLLRNLGEVATELGDYARAETSLQEGLALARQINHHEQISAQLTNLGVVAYERGDYEQAETFYHEGLSLARKMQNYERVSLLLSYLGTVAYKRGNDRQAEACFQEGLALARKIGHRERISLLLMNHGVMATVREDYRRAEDYFQEGLALARKIGHRERIIGLLLYMGVSAIQEENYTQGSTYFQEALAIALHIGKRWRVSYVLAELGELCLRQNQITEAASAFDDVLTNAPAGSRELAAWAHYGLARVALARGNVAEASHLAGESNRIFTAMSHRSIHEVRNFLAALPVYEWRTEEAVQ